MGGCFVMERFKECNNCRQMLDVANFHKKNLQKMDCKVNAKNAERR